MSTTYMLDTNMLIYWLKNKPTSAAKRVDGIRADDTLVMSYVTYAELLKGVQNSSKPDKVLGQLAALCEMVEVLLPNTDAICHHYAAQFLQLKTKGTPIGSNDLWIACHALAIGAVVVTHNTSEFNRVTGLSVEDWTRLD